MKGFFIKLGWDFPQCSQAPALSYVSIMCDENVFLLQLGASNPYGILIFLTL